MNPLTKKLATALLPLFFTACEHNQIEKPVQYKGEAKDFRHTVSDTEILDWCQSLSRKTFPLGGIRGTKEARHLYEADCVQSIKEGFKV